MRILCLVLCLMMPLPLWATDPYTISHITVDEATRNAAMNSAQRQAFVTLISQITQTSSELVKLPSDADLEGMVQDFEIDEEKLSSTRYKATMTVRFQPQAIEAYLGTQKDRVLPTQPSGEMKDIKILLVPVVSSQTPASFWEEKSDFWQSWEGFSSPDKQITLVMPQGDIADISQIRLNQITDGDQIALSRWAEHYGANGVVVAERFVDHIQLTYYPVQGLAAQESVPISRLNPSEIFPEIQTLLKKNPQEALAPEQILFVRVHPKSLSDWIDFQDILNQISQIKNQKILEFEVSLVKLELTMQLSTEQFEKILGRYHFALTPTSQPNEWDIVDAPPIS